MAYAISHRQAERLSIAPITTLFDTAHGFDAGLAALDGPTDPEDGGLRIMFDGRHEIPSLVITTAEGEFTICGHALIKQLTDAALTAESYARRMAKAA
jgi:hypothetical protein